MTELEELIKALWPYVKHKKDCEYVTEPHPKCNPCTCGLDDLIRKKIELVK